MQKPLSVSDLNEQIKAHLSMHFECVYVEGEVSNLTYHNSGHIYFSIKDESSMVSCVMFASNARYLKFRLENGQKILISGNISVYSPRGSYQVLCSKITQSGAGDLAVAYEQLKKELEQKGWFDKEHKKLIPKFPKKIGVATSDSGAAIEDMKKILNQRYPLCEMIIAPTIVQGEGASGDIVKSIEFLDKQNCDVIIAGRGGGSIEDLWAFNTKEVAMAFYNAKTPIISAVGHESDYLISDLVADLRASTPSNAIELALPDINELRIMLDEYLDTFERICSNIINTKTHKFDTIKEHIEYFNPIKKIQLSKDSVDVLNEQFDNYFSLLLEGYENSLRHIYSLFKPRFENFISHKTHILLQMSELLDIANPKNKIKDGYAQIIKNNKITKLQDLNNGDNFELLASNTKIEAKVIKTSYIKS